MKNFIYLVQGSSEKIKKYQHLKNRCNSECIFLTYDNPLENCEFFPNSTFAEGRNKLLDMSKAKGKYLYTIFCDDDVEFIKGDWNLFEINLLKVRPKIGIPIMPKARNLNSISKIQKYQTARVIDQQMMAFSEEIINNNDSKILPYLTQYDKQHWWIGCEIQEHLIRHYYGLDIVQFNDVEISNRGTGSYMSRMQIKKSECRKYVLGHFFEIARYPELWDLANPDNSNRISLKKIANFYSEHNKHPFLDVVLLKLSIKQNIDLIYYNFEIVPLFLLRLYLRYKVRYLFTSYNKNKSQDGSTDVRYKD